MLSPADIEKKAFSTTRIKEGYDQDEVDDFLDSCGAALQDALDQLTAAQSEAVSAKSQLATVQRQLDAYGQADTQVQPAAVVSDSPPGIPAFLGDVSRILGVAQMSADQQVAEAKATADGIVSDANTKAAAMIGDATKASEDAKNKAQLDLYQVQQRLQDVKDREAAARAFLVDHLAALKTTLEANNG